MTSAPAVTERDDMGTCGDGVVDPMTEDCDDGAANGSAGDACTLFCHSPARSTPTATTATRATAPRPAPTTRAIAGTPAGRRHDVRQRHVVSRRHLRVASRCGDGIVTAPEECDDGNVIDGDGCDNDCTLQLQVDAIRRATARRPTPARGRARATTRRTSARRARRSATARRAAPATTTARGRLHDADVRQQRRSSRAKTATTAGSTAPRTTAARRCASSPASTPTTDCGARARVREVPVHDRARLPGGRRLVAERQACAARCSCARTARAPRATAVCGNGVVEPGEDCDFGARQRTEHRLRGGDVQVLVRQRGRVRRRQRLQRRRDLRRGDGDQRRHGQEVQRGHARGGRHRVRHRQGVRDTKICQNSTCGDGVVDPRTRELRSAGLGRRRQDLRLALPPHRLRRRRARGHRAVRRRQHHEPRRLRQHLQVRAGAARQLARHVVRHDVCANAIALGGAISRHHDQAQSELQSSLDPRASRTARSPS